MQGFLLFLIEKSGKKRLFYITSWWFLHYGEKFFLEFADFFSVMLVRARAFPAIFSTLESKRKLKCFAEKSLDLTFLVTTQVVARQCTAPCLV